MNCKLLICMLSLILFSCTDKSMKSSDASNVSVKQAEQLEEENEELKTLEDSIKMEMKELEGLLNELEN